METPDMATDRCKSSGKNTKFDKVVKREVCQVATRGTISHSVIEGQATDPQPSYLLALTEKVSFFIYGFYSSRLSLIIIFKIKNHCYVIDYLSL